MRLPNADRAFIYPSKIQAYLLSPEHPVGRAKARFFLALGFRQTDWSRLRTSLERHGRIGRAREVPSPYGRKFEVEGIIEGPNGRKAAVVSVWIVLTGESAPRLVTALPGTRA
jgi:hypothetical protein